MALQLLWATGSGTPLKKQGEGDLVIYYDESSKDTSLTVTGSQSSFTFESGSALIVGKEETASTFYRIQKDGEIAFSSAGTDEETVLSLKNGQIDLFTRDNKDALLSSESRAQGSIYSFTVADNTPSVKKGNIFQTQNSSRGAADIETFDDGTVGQVITILIKDNYTDFNQAARTNPLKLKGNANWTTSATGDTISFVFDGSNWVEIYRSINS